jgi:DNA-binding IclR family transcriptional regulator
MALTGTQAVDRATSLLIAILNSPEPPLLSELARELGLPKSTTSRILGALERQGLIRRDRNSAY